MVALSHKTPAESLADAPGQDDRSAANKADGGREIEPGSNGGYPTVGRGWPEIRLALREFSKQAFYHPWVLLGVERRLAGEMRRIATGRSQLAPTPGDARFEDAAWTDNPALRRLLQSYLAWSQALFDLIDRMRLDPEQKRRATFVAQQVTAAAAPSNLFLTHPGFYRRIVETRGRSALSGLRHFLGDLRDGRRLPRQVDESAFRIGHNLAVTEGAVVHRNAVYELIQYRPRCSAVDSRPMLFCPPQINKYYVLDLAPDKSLVRHVLDAGQQVFVISWRNPTAAQGDWGLETYVEAVRGAIDAVSAISGGHPVKLAGACAGGLTAAVTLARLAASKEQAKVACLSLFMTLLDSPRAGHAADIVNETAIDISLARSQNRGVLDGADMARAFAWLRPEDLVWHFVVNNYVLGHRPPANDILYWNSDTTRLPARLHADFLAIYRDNALFPPSRLELDGEVVDMSRIQQDVFVVAGARDRITPWQACYRSVQLFRSDVQFVLSTAGHVQSLTCPPGKEDASYRVNDDYTLDSASWYRGSQEYAGSWWPLWLRWCEHYGGEEVPAPLHYGNSDFEPFDIAPGRYVKQR